METISFFKISGSGNDFLLFEKLEEKLKEKLSQFANFVCRRRGGVGADGLILLEDSSVADFKIRYFNSDGSEAAFCGNGGRCVAWYAHFRKKVGEEMVFEASDRLHKAKVKGLRVKLEMASPKDIHLGFTLQLKRKELTVNSLNIGVPHVVIMVNDIETVDILEIGREIRYHPSFAPAGTNVNFVQIKGKHRIRIRTYERGVEEETLACGTGAVASSIVAHLLGKVLPPVLVQTQGGENLKVYFERKEQGFSFIFLEGEVRPIFEGRMVIPKEFYS